MGRLMITQRPFTDKETKLPPVCFFVLLLQFPELCSLAKTSAINYLHKREKGLWRINRGKREVKKDEHETTSH